MADKITTIVGAANVKIDSYRAPLFVKLLEKCSLRSNKWYARPPRIKAAEGIEQNACYVVARLWNLSRPQGFEAVMRVRCSQGLQIQEYSGIFCKRIPTDIYLPAAEAPKRKVKKTNVLVSELVYGALPASNMQKAIEEFEMALQDRVMEETKDKKNAVEAYVYDMRNKEKDELSTNLQEVEDWLYEDGEDKTKGVYVARLDELKKQGDLIEERYMEWRGPVAMSKDPKFNHIDMAKKQKVFYECQEADAWLKQKIRQQDALLKYATSVLLPTDLKRKIEAVDSAGMGLIDHIHISKIQ